MTVSIALVFATVAERPSGLTPMARGPLGHGVRVQPRGGDDLVELEVDGAEARPDDVPVHLLGHQGEVHEIHQGALQGVADHLRSASDSGLFM